MVFREIHKYIFSEVTNSKNQNSVLNPNLCSGGETFRCSEQSPAHNPNRRVLRAEATNELLRGRPPQGVVGGHLAGAPAPWAAVPGGGQKVPWQFGAGHRGAVAPTGQGVALTQNHAAAEMPGEDAPGEAPGAQDLHPSETEHLRGHRPLQAATLRQEDELIPRL